MNTVEEWFEDSCSFWVEHYNFMLSCMYNSDDEIEWYKEQILFNRLYDV